jgi:hypothetical protein
MYVWIWRHLPGGLPGKLVGSLVLLGAAVIVLFTVVFPAVEPLLPFTDVTVDSPAETSPGAGEGSAEPAPSPPDPAAPPPPEPTG